MNILNPSNIKLNINPIKSITPINIITPVNTVNRVTSTITKQSTQNIDFVDVVNPSENEYSHQFIDKCNFSDVSINLNTGEITPKIETENVSMEIVNPNNDIKQYPSKQSNKNNYTTLTLNPIAEEEILGIEAEYIFSGVTSIRNKNDEEIIDCNTNLVSYTTNEPKEKFDAYIINKNHTNYADMESLNYMTFDLKDFNLSSVDNIDFHANPYGEIKDYDSKFKLNSFIYSPYGKVKIFDNNGKGVLGKVKDSIGNTYYIDYQMKSVDNSNSVEEQLKAGIHDVGYINENYYIGTKVQCLNDFILNEEKTYIYNAINRPMIFKKVIDSETNELSDFIKPMVAQSFSFDKDYVITKIAPKFLFPSNIPEEYNSTGNIKLIIDYGFLIDGKINENGIINTRIFTEFNSIRQVMNEGITLNHPVFVPKGTDFFVGFTIIAKDVNDSDIDFGIKFLENGKYDKSGNLISFPSGVKTKMFYSGEEFSNRLLKIELFVAVYDTDSKPFVTLYVDGDEQKQISALDRCILFDNDFHPNDTVLSYEMVDSNNKFHSIKKNEEFIADKTKAINSLRITLGTNNKYVSPIINLSGLNLFVKKYTADIKSFTVITNYSPYNAKCSIFKFRIDNINCWKKNNSYGVSISGDDLLMNTYVYLLRVNFDYHLNYYGNNIDQNIVRFISVDAISKTTGERFKVYAPNAESNPLSSLDGNRIDIVDLEENGWKRANCEYALAYIVNPLTIENQNNNNNYVEYYPFIAYLDQFELEVSIIIGSYNNTIIGAEGIKNIICSVDTLVVSNKSEKITQSLELPVYTYDV